MSLVYEAFRRELEKIAFMRGSSRKADLVEDIGAYDDLIGDLNRSRPSGYRQRILVAKKRRSALQGQLSKVANSMMGYGGKNMGGAAMMPLPSMNQGVGSLTPQPSTSMTTPSAAAPKINMKGAPGASNMEGMSIHCDKCFAEIKEQQPKFCPKCGNRIKAVRDLKSAPKNGDVEEKQRGQDHESGLESGPTGGDAAVNEELAESAESDMGKYSAALAHPLIMKLAGVKHQKGSRFKAFNLRPRGGKHTTVEGGLRRIAKATAKYTKHLPSVV